MSYPTSTEGVLGHFAEPDEALEAAAKVRDSEYTHFDILTPFPVHGMDEAMGQPRSWIPWATAALAGLGIFAAQALMNYIMVYDWPMNFGGKPHFAWPSFIPITFELMVLFSAIGSAIVAIWAGKRFTVPQPPPMEVKTGATIDRFVVWISATDPKYDESATAEFMRSLGALGVRVVNGRESDDA
jgi:Alternative complex III, ActD subunit